MPFAQSSSDMPHPCDASSSEVLIPSASRSQRQKQPPKHLQDFHCYTTSNDIPYPMINYISYSYLSEPFRAFINIITNDIVPQKYSEIKKLKVFCDAMKMEIDAMNRTETWSVCPLPSNKTAIGSKWVNTVGSKRIYSS